MANYFAFIDESGVLDESKRIQPFFGVGFLKILDTSLISERLTQRHYDYFSFQKDKRRRLLEELKKNSRPLDDKDINMNRPRDSKIHFETELNKLPNVFNTLRAHSETFTLLQICDLMLGSILFQWREMRGFVKESNRAKAKKEFVDYLISKLVVPSNKSSEFPLAQAITCQSPIYFSVWPLKLSPKTKSGGV